MSRTSTITNNELLDYIEVNIEDYFIENVPTYVETRNEFAIYDGLLQSKKPLLIRGPKGIGKTLSIASWVSQRPKIPFIQYDCSEGTKESNLIGRSIIHKDGTTPFKLGVIPTAIELANKAKAAVLCLEEISSLPPAMQKLLNPLLDWRKGLFIEQLNKRFSLDKDAILIVFATTNPSSTGGVFELNQDLKSRFAIMSWDYPITSQETAMLEWFGIPSDFVTGLLKLANETRALEKKGDIEYGISTRDIADALDMYRSYSKTSGIDPRQLVLELKVLGNYDDADQVNTIMSRIESIFGKSIFSQKAVDK